MMSLYEENFYWPFYLFNAVIEYIYFVIILIQNNGPKPIVNIQRHLKFFKCEVAKFIHAFHGKNEVEKCANMLCTATPIFYSFNGMMYLSKNFVHFKQCIYEDLILSYTSDIVLRGTKNISEICKALNVNNLIKIDQKTLTSILKQYSFFYEDKKKSMVMLPYNWLDDFTHALDDVERYFLSILQNNYVMTYEDVKVHSGFILSCGIHSYLTTFCLLVASNIFECKNNKIYLNFKSRKMKFQNQWLNVIKLDTSPLFSGLTTSLIVHLLYGKKVHNWIGEVNNVMKSGGFIYCSVYFKDYSHDMFVVYFHKKDLKSISAIEDLRNYISFRDLVMFDARYYEGFCGRYWKATKLKIVKQSFRKNVSNYDIDVDEYEKREYDSLELNTVIKTNLHSKCSCKYSKCELASNFSNDCIPKSYDEFVEFLKESFNFSDQELSLNSSAYEIKNNTINSNPVTLESEISSTAVKNYDSHSKSLGLFNSSKLSLCDETNSTNKEQQLFNTKVKRPLKLSLKEILKCHTSDDDMKTSFNNCTNSKIRQSKENKVENLLISHYTFVFGEIELASKDFGVINGYTKYNYYTVHFLKNVFVTLDDFVDVDKIKKFDKVLAFVPSIDDDTCLVASLVFLLNSNEVLFISKHKLCPSKFVFQYFLPRIKEKCDNLLEYFDLSAALTFDMPFKFAANSLGEVRRTCSTFLISLTEVCNVDDKMKEKFRTYITEVSKKNWINRNCKSFSTISSLILFIFSFLNNHKLNKTHTKKYYYYYKHAIDENNKNHAFHHLKKKRCSIYKMPSISSFEYDNTPKQKELVFKSRSMSENCLVPKIDEKNNFNYCKDLSKSCSSLGSHFSLAESSIKSSSSCISVDSFYSCKSSNSLNGSSINFLDTLMSKTKQSFRSASSPQLNIIPPDNNLDSNLQTFKNVTAYKLYDVTFKDITNNEKRTDKKLKLNHKSLLSMKCLHVWRKRKSILPDVALSKNVFRHKVETVANVCIMTNTFIFLTPKNNQLLTLCFPKKLIPVKMQSKIVINSVVRITYVPCVPLNLSHVLSLEIDD